MNRHKFHDVACQGNLKFCQGIVREMSGNFVSTGAWQPCTGQIGTNPHCWFFFSGAHMLVNSFPHHKALPYISLVTRKSVLCF